jgi:hypothetical protein
MKQNKNFEKSQELKDRSEKFKNQWQFLVGAWTCKLESGEEQLCAFNELISE